MATKKGLGKGLDSLIVSKDNTDEITNVSRETLININKIEPNQLQPRRNFEEDALQELAESIKIHGIIQPLIVQKKNNDMYEIIAGERRWRASRIAGLKEVPVIIKEYSEQEIFEIALIENIQREDLNPIEEAMAYSRLVNEYNLKQDEVADRVSKSRVAVTNSLRLLKLDQRVQQMLIDDMISGGHARALLPISDPEQQFHYANQVFDDKLSVRETEKLVKKLITQKDSKKTSKGKENDENDLLVYRDVEEKLKQIIGSKVSIKRKENNKGSIEIEYYSAEELERILDLFRSVR